MNAAQLKSKHNRNNATALRGGTQDGDTSTLLAHGGTLDSPLKRGGLLNLAARLRRSPHWSRLAEQRIHRMAKRLRGPTSNGLGEPQKNKLFLEIICAFFFVFKVLKYEYEVGSGVWSMLVIRTMFTRIGCTS